MAARINKWTFGPLELWLEWRLTLFTLLLCPGLVALGFWQLDRADEKRALAERHLQRESMVALNADELFQRFNQGWSSESAAALADRRVAVSATFDPNAYLLLDNRLRKGRFGYEVIALLQTAQGRVPVNMGWLPGDPARRTLPEVALPNGAHQLTGRVYAPSKAAYTLDEEAVIGVLPATVQAFEAATLAPQLAELLGEPVLPLLIRVSPGDPRAFDANWVVINQSPQKHTGYAVQWFTMAGVLVMAFLLRSTNIWQLLIGSRRSESS